jgi:hypothetical protein
MRRRSSTADVEARCPSQQSESVGHVPRPSGSPESRPVAPIELDPAVSRASSARHWYAPALPLGWHWLSLAPRLTDSELRSDGYYEAGSPHGGPP